MSILTSIVNKKMDSLGNIKIYTKVVHLKDKRNWGFFKKDMDDVTLYVPLWIQIQNTSSVPKIIRDFNLHLYDHNNYISKTIQATQSGAIENSKIYGNNGAYTFVIEPLSIANYECLFMINKSSINKTFDEIRIEFYDSKDRSKKYKFKSIENCWDITPRQIDSDWVKIATI